MAYLTVALPLKASSRGASSTLRPMTHGDLDAAAALWLRAHPPALTSAETRESVREDLAAGLDGTYGQALAGGCLVAADGSGTPCGAIQTTVDVPWGEAPRGAFVIELFVSPEHRHQGVATALLGAAATASRAAGHATLSLQVDADNVPAAALYERLGFAPARG